MNGQKIGVAIVGSGLFVKEEHLPAVQACSDIELKAIYSRSMKSAKAVSENLSGIDLYSDDSDSHFEDLLTRSDIQGVIIALPILVQPDFIKQALGAGKHVLAEKPVAKDLATAKELIKWYESTVDKNQATLGIAEQIRYLPELVLGARKVQEFGRVIGFRLKLGQHVTAGSKYYETPWRKVPEYQGGFLLDGGVHFVAAMRLLLGHDARAQRVAAFTAQLQEHLPPVDTVDATLRLASGATGNISMSFGTTFQGSEYSVACEGGTVTVSRNKVVSKPWGGEENVEATPNVPSGVQLEVFAWAKSLLNRGQDPKQSPEQALADLEIIESMLRSGEKDGQPMELQYQL